MLCDSIRPWRFTYMVCVYIYRGHLLVLVSVVLVVVLLLRLFSLRENKSSENNVAKKCNQEIHSKHTYTTRKWIRCCRRVGVVVSVG